MMTSSKSHVTQGTILIFLEILKVSKILTKFELNWTRTSRENQGGIILSCWETREAMDVKSGLTFIIKTTINQYLKFLNLNQTGEIVLLQNYYVIA